VRDRTEAGLQLLRPSQREIALQLAEGDVGSAKDCTRKIEQLFCRRTLWTYITHRNQCHRVFAAHFPLCLAFFFFELSVTSQSEKIAKHY
jgi:hypothetical protein